jgi:hypothetical protein
VAEAVDDDTERAILALWLATPALAALLPAPPVTGRIHSRKDLPARLPYGHIVCEAVPGRAVRYPKGFRKDVRKATITVRGLRADVVKAAPLVLAVFNSQMTLPGRQALVFPSFNQQTGLPKLIKWWPLNDGALDQEEAQVQGNEVWRLAIEAEVYTSRSES